MSSAISRCRLDDGVFQNLKLAEAVASGLHSLAQPLAALQLGLEMCLAEADHPERQRQRVQQALLETERIYHRLSAVRETVLPYRRRWKQLETRSLREALEQACRCPTFSAERLTWATCGEKQSQTSAEPHGANLGHPASPSSKREAIEVCFDPQSSPAEITAPPDAISRLAFTMIGYLHCAGKGVAHLVLSEWHQRIRLDVACTNRPFSRNTDAMQLLALIRAYVSALEGEVEVSEAAALLRVELWKSCEAPVVRAG